MVDMPTVPPQPARLSEHEPHHPRQMAESFGVDPERYDRTRPRYPDAMVDAIAAASPGTDVLDVGIGTGIAARQFHAAGCRVLGVEPDARMAEFARRGGFAIEVTTFEAWDPAGRAFDAVVSGQTWHWVDPVAGAAKAAEALRRGGRLAVFWNVDQPPPELAEAFAAVYRRVMPDSPVARRSTMSGSDGYAMLCDKAADGIRQVGAFGDPERWKFDWERSYARDEWLDQLPTTGVLTRLPPAILDEVLTGIGAAIDAAGGSFHDAVHRGGRHCGANRSRLSGHLHSCSDRSESGRPTRHPRTRSSSRCRGPVQRQNGKSGRSTGDCWFCLGCACRSAGSWLTVAARRRRSSRCAACCDLPSLERVGGKPWAASPPPSKRSLAGCERTPGRRLCGRAQGATGGVSQHLIDERCSSIELTVR